MDVIFFTVNPIIPGMAFLAQKIKKLVKKLTTTLEYSNHTINTEGIGGTFD